MSVKQRECYNLEKKQEDEARLRHEVDWRWVKGHAGHEFNERADALARRGLQEIEATM